MRKLDDSQLIEQPVQGWEQDTPEFDYEPSMEDVRADIITSTWRLEDGD